MPHRNLKPSTISHAFAFSSNKKKLGGISD